MVFVNVEIIYEEVEVFLFFGCKGKGGKKELIKVKWVVFGDKVYVFVGWKEWVFVFFGFFVVVFDFVEVVFSFKFI